MNESWAELGNRPAVERASAAEFLAPVIEYAASELLRDGHDLARALPEVLARLGAPLECRCVLALRQDVAQPLTVIAAHPAEVVADAALLTELNELTVVHRGRPGPATRSASPCAGLSRCLASPTGTSSSAC